MLFGTLLKENLTPAGVSTQEMTNDDDDWDDDLDQDLVDAIMSQAP